jgi:diaminopimelate decarboxylase
MVYFDYKDGILHAEDVALTAIASAVGTPAYVYSTAALLGAARAFRDGLAPISRKRLAFAVKANPNLAILRLLAQEGYGADIVSAGEMLHALKAGMAAADIVFSGVGKSRTELAAALDARIGQFNLELEEEGVVLASLANARNTRAPAVLRVNPDVDAHTHEKISTGRRSNKFGVALADAPEIYARLAKLEGLDLRGIAVHIGSQISDLSALEAACESIGVLLGKLRAAGHTIGQVDLGGGLGVSYKADELFPTSAAYGAMIARATHNWDVTLTFEPGRFIAAHAGVLLTEVLWVKPGADAPYVIVDAAMNDLARPALYGAFHGFEAVQPSGERMCANIAGPVCETGDTFAMARDIDAVRSGDLGVFRTAGAYGATMASTYNCRALVPEVLVDGDQFAVVADRVQPETKMATQHMPVWMDDDEFVAKKRKIARLTSANVTALEAPRNPRQLRFLRSQLARV